MSLQLLQVAVPAIWWDPAGSPRPDFALMAREALDIERRLPKAVDTGRDRRRYAACCASLENMAIQSYSLVASTSDFATCLAQNGRPAQRLSDDYIEWLAALLEQAPAGEAEARLAASFFPPGLLGRHLRVLTSLIGPTLPVSPESVQRRLAFGRLAEEAGCGLVEMAVFAAEAKAITFAVDARAQRVASPRLTILASAPPAVDEAVEQAQTLSEWAALRLEISQALAGGGPVNLGRYRHAVIVGVLHELIYRQRAGGPAEIPVLYADGSQAAPFPIGSRQLDPAVILQAEAATPKRVALISIRHPEMDVDVDIAWLPNRGASRVRDSQADTDAWCFQHSLEQFRSFPGDELTVVDLYHTGLEPAVVAFYRALLTGLDEGWLRAAVRPRLYHGPSLYTAGAWWV
jgi:hypothetical protein